MRRFLLTLTLLLLLTGCGLPGRDPLPTPYPADYIPTVIAMTAAAASAAPDGLIATPTVTAISLGGADPATQLPLVVPPTLPAATATLALGATPLPGVLQISAPGPMSKVISPIVVRGPVMPGYGGVVRVELLGEDGRMLGRNLQRLYTLNVPWAQLQIEMPFEIRAAAELGRLQVITEDEYGRTTAIYAVHLLLQSSGLNEITPLPDRQERLQLIEPAPAAQVTGGILIVRGTFQPFNDFQPLVVELLRPDGVPLTSRMIELNGGGEFLATLGYQVRETAAYRLVLRQADDRIPGTMYLYSQEVWLSP